MPARKLITLYIVFAACIFAVKAQDSNRVVKPSTRYITEQDIDLNLDYRHVDTTIERSEIFHQGYQHTVFQDLGNIGTPARQLLFDPERRTGFQYAFNPFALYFIKPEETRYYNTKTPYTDLFYAQGSNELLFLKAKHSQNILPRWNVGVDYQRITSQGFYLKQKTSIYNYQFFTRYQSKNKRYDLLVHGTWNRGVVEESGGITSDSAFESLTGATKTVNVNLNNSQTRFRSRVGYLKQYYRFGKGGFFVSGEDDSTYDFHPRLQLSHTLVAEDLNYIFENSGDTNSVLLPHRYYDITPVTYDSAFLGRLSNRVQLHEFGRQHRFLGDTMQSIFSGGITHEFINVGQATFARRYTNVIAEGGWEEVSVGKRIVMFAVKGAITLSGYNAGDHKLQGVITLPTRWAYLRLSAMQQQYRPDFTMQLFRSNQFIWSNSFSPTRFQKLGAELVTTRFRHNFRVAFNNYYTQNIVVAGTDATPMQLRDALLTTIEVSKTFQAGRFFFEHTLIYQKSSSSFINLPELSGMIRYYVQGRLFKVMRFQAGFDVFYNTAYYGNAYNPATRLFYVQQDQKVGNYPVIDPFVVAEIKRATIFAKYEHANQDLFNRGFYYTPNYPISLSSFRFGIRWRFYN